MNILKIYSNREIMLTDMKEFARNNPDSTFRSRYDTVKLYNGTLVIFRVIRDDHDWHTVAGLEVQCLDVSPTAHVDAQTISFLMSRVRGF